MPGLLKLVTGVTAIPRKNNSYSKIFLVLLTS